MNEIKGLLENDWKFFDEVQMKRKKAMVVIPLLLFVFFVLYFLIHFMFAIFNVSFDTILNKLILTIVLVIIILSITTVKISGMDRDKTDWYFAALRDNRLEHKAMLGMMRKFLAKHKYQFEEGETKRTIDLRITYFDIPGSNFKTRVWFTKINRIPTVEIGIGPETGINKKTIGKLKRDICSEFKKVYGT